MERNVKSDMEKVSIVVPVYNKAHCLARCLDSVLAQTWQDFALILVDDGSRDDSLSLCRQYAAQDPRIRVIAKENGGVSTARNAGIEVSAGEYIIFLDSDDWWEPNFLEVMLSLADRYGKTVLPMCGMYYEAASRKTVLFSQEAETVLDQTGIYPIYRKHFLNMLWNKVFVGEVVRRQNIRFSEGLSWGEDKLFILQYLRHIKRYSILNQPLYHYDISDTGLDNCFKKDELRFNEMLHRALFDFEAELEKKTPEGHRMLCTEYMRVQIQGATRQLKLAKTLRYAQYLRQDRLLRDCMEQLRQDRQCTRWLCWCQKHSALLLILTYNLKKKLRRGPAADRKEYGI